MSRPFRIAIISHTQTANDPRVIRQARALSDDGFDVTTFGMGEASSGMGWPHVEVAPLAPYENAPALPETPRPGARLLRRVGQMLWFPSRGLGRLLMKLADRHDRGLGLVSRARHYAMLGFWLRIAPSRWSTVFWDQYTYAAKIRDEVLSRGAVDLVIANDWECLPSACAVSNLLGAKIWYDAHEFTADEFAGQRRFRIWHKPLAVAVEGSLIRYADQVSSVSDGLCSALQQRYKLPIPPVCIRNVPPYSETEWRPHDSANIRVLYQGIVAPGRGLLELVDSVALWPEALSLIIRGPHYDTAFVDALDSAIAQSPARARIVREKPVPFADLVPAASNADIGVMLLPDDTTHNRYALPNKIFEYMMGGLALLVSDLPEMSAIVDAEDCGKTVARLSPSALAAVASSLMGPQLESCRRASLQAATRHNWERESTTFLAEIRRCLDTPTAREDS